MKAVLYGQAAEVTIVTPNSLQKDLTEEVYAKKRTVSGRFADQAPLTVAADDLTGCLPTYYTIYVDVGGH